MAAAAYCTMTFNGHSCLTFLLKMQIFVRIAAKNDDLLLKKRSFIVQLAVGAWSARSGGGDTKKDDFMLKMMILC